MHGGNWKKLRKVLHVLSYFAIEIAHRGQCKTWEFFVFNQYKAMDLRLVIEHTLTVKWVIHIYFNVRFPKTTKLDPQIWIAYFDLA